MGFETLMGISAALTGAGLFVFMSALAYDIVRGPRKFKDRS